MLATLLATLMAPPRVLPCNGRRPERLRVLDVRAIKDYQTRCLVASAQGLYNRQNKPDKVWVVWGEPDLFWRDWLVKQHYVRKAEPLGSINELIRLLPTKKAVVYDEKPFHLPNVATTVAGIKGEVLVGDESLLDRYGLTASTDLRRKFKTNVEAYDWLFLNYGDRISRKVTSITVPVKTPTHNPANLRDYLVANNVFTFWVSGGEEKSLAGTDIEAEKVVVSNILKNRVDADGPCLGYPWSGDGYGLGEWDGVPYLSQHARYLIPTDNFTNLSVWSLFPASTRQLKQPVRKFSPDPKKRYAAIMMSDGDNLCTFQEFFPAYWKGLKGKTFPMGWTMGPLLNQFAPPMYDYACANIPREDAVGSGVSGVGYIAMEEYAKAFGASGQDHISNFLSQTQAACAASGEDWLWIMRYGGVRSEYLKGYGALKGIKTIMGGYGQVTKVMSESTELASGTPVIHSVLDAWSPKDFEDKIGPFLAAPDCPQAFSVFILNWNFKPDDLKKLASTLRSKGVELVTPQELGLVVKDLRSVRFRKAPETQSEQTSVGRF